MGHLFLLSGLDLLPIVGEEKVAMQLKKGLLRMLYIWGKESERRRNDKSIFVIEDGSIMRREGKRLEDPRCEKPPDVVRGPFRSAEANDFPPLFPSF